MSVRTSNLLISCFYALAYSFVTCYLATSSAAQSLAFTDENSEPWSPVSYELAIDQEESQQVEIALDESVAPVQMLTPQRRISARTARLPGRPTGARRNSNLASVPFMIGDTGAGSCIAFGNFLDVELAHPTLACSRLNIAESNTPLPTDRLFYSYRHFHNATPARAYQFTEDFNIDRHTLAGERTFFDKMMSMEIRIPIDKRLNSQTGTYLAAADSAILPPGRDPIFGVGGEDTRVELGNISMIFKALLIERKNFALSGGLGVTLPTARDVTFDALVDDEIILPQAPFLARYTIVLSGIASNESLYVSPYLAWLWQEKEEKWFHQGFLQVETSTNPSFFTAGGFGQTSYDTNGNGIVSTNPIDAGDAFVDFTDPLPIGVTKIQPQTILRLNLGWGYVLKENKQADWIKKLTGIFEMHYSTTLNKAKINTIPFFINSSTFTGFDQNGISVGNFNNRIDILNVVTGLSAEVGNWVVTNGVTAPIRTGSDRGFDFEYNLQLQRPF